MDFKFNVYKSSGKPHVLRIFEFSEDSPVQIPDGSIILHTELLDADTIEVWASVPVSSTLDTRSYYAPAEPVLEKDEEVFPVGYPDEELQDDKPVEDMIFEDDDY